MLFMVIMHLLHLNLQVPLQMQFWVVLIQMHVTIMKMLMKIMVHVNIHKKIMIVKVIVQLKRIV